MTPTLAPVIPIIPQPRPEDAPLLSAKGAARFAQALYDAGITPAILRREPALAVFIPPLEALIAAAGTP